MNRKIYLPAASLLVCVTYIIVAKSPMINKMLMVGAACIFALLFVRALRSGKK